MAVGLKACVVCGVGSVGPRCSRHAVAVPDYGFQHQRRRRRLLGSAVGGLCPLCGKVMAVGEPLDLDHTTRAMTHASCNRRAGAAMTH